MTIAIYRTVLLALGVCVCVSTQVTGEDLSEILDANRNDDTYNDLSGYNRVLSPETVADLETLKSSLGVLGRLGDTDRVYDNLELPEADGGQVDQSHEWRLPSDTNAPQKLPYGSNIEIFNSGRVQLEYPGSREDMHADGQSNDDFGSNRLPGRFPGRDWPTTTEEDAGTLGLADNPFHGFDFDKRNVFCVNRRCRRARNAKRNDDLLQPSQYQLEGDTKSDLSEDPMDETPSSLKSKRNPFCVGRRCRGKRLPDQDTYNGPRMSSGAMEKLIALAAQRKAYIESNRIGSSRVSPYPPLDKRDNKNYHTIIFGCDTSGYCVGDNAANDVIHPTKRKMNDNHVIFQIVQDKNTAEWRAIIKLCQDDSEMKCSRQTPYGDQGGNSCETKGEEIRYGQFFLTWRETRVSNWCTGTLIEGAITKKVSVKIPCQDNKILLPTMKPHRVLKLNCKKGRCEGRCGMVRPKANRENDGQSFLQGRRSNTKCAYKNCD